MLRRWSAVLSLLLCCSCAAYQNACASNGQTFDKTVTDIEFAVVSGCCLMLPAYSWLGCAMARAGCLLAFLPTVVMSSKLWAVVELRWLS